MSQVKLEVIVLTESGIMLQEITFLRRSDYKPIVRLPTIEEITKVTDGCSASLKELAEAGKHDEISTELLDIVFEKMVEKHGRENVQINEDKSLTVTDNGKKHTIRVD